MRSFDNTGFISHRALIFAPVDVTGRNFNWGRFETDVFYRCYLTEHLAFESVRRDYAGSFIVTAYSSMVALTYGAMIGERGLNYERGRGRVVFVGNTAVGSLIGGVTILVESIISALN